MTKTDTKKRLRIYIIAAVILVIIVGAAAFVWYRFRLCEGVLHA